jgi:hypothetical protein
MMPASFVCGGYLGASSCSRLPVRCDLHALVGATLPLNGAVLLDPRREGKGFLRRQRGLFAL